MDVIRLRYSTPQLNALPRVLYYTLKTIKKKNNNNKKKKKKKKKKKNVYIYKQTSDAEVRDIWAQDAL